jgi:hypothetical protein
VFPIYADARAAVREGSLDAAPATARTTTPAPATYVIRYYSRVVKPGGVVGFVVADMSAALDTLPPPELADHRTQNT